MSVGPDTSDSYGADFFDPKRYGGRFNQYWWARRFYASLIGRYGGSGRVLEIGCGLGHVLARLEDRFETHGIDVSPYAIEQARKNSPRSILRVATAEEIETLPGPFDTIAAFHVVEHLEDPAPVLQACYRMSRSGGCLLIATPNPQAPFARRKGDRWYANQDPTHISLKDPAEWRALVEQAGYQITKTFGDGLWDVPYLPGVPAVLQLPFFGLPGLVQVVTAVPFIPVRFSESLILVARKP